MEKVLIACEKSQRVCIAFRKLGLEDAVISSTSTSEEVEIEAADVANFAMMIAERYRVIYRQ